MVASFKHGFKKLLVLYYYRPEAYCEKIKTIRVRLEKLLSSYGDCIDYHFLKLRMYEMGLNQKSLAKLVGVSPSRLSDYISGKCEPTLKVAREISRKLNIDANIVLGV